MKNLHSILSESLLDLDNDTIVDRQAKNPFKFLVNLPDNIKYNPTEYNEALKVFESILAKYCKIKTPEQSMNAKYKIAIRYSFNPPKIYIKRGRVSYSLTPDNHYLSGWNLYEWSARAHKIIWGNCNQVYVPNKEMEDIIEEFINIHVGNASRKLYPEKWEAWEKYKRS